MSSSSHSDQASSSQETDNMEVLRWPMANVSLSSDIGEISPPVLTIQWTIQDFLSYYTEDPEDLHLGPPRRFYGSSSFYVLDTRWHFQIYPYGDSLFDESDDSHKWISLYLQVTHYTAAIEKASFHFGLRRADGEIEKIGDDYHFDFRCYMEDDCERYGTCKFLERSKLLERRSELVPSGALTVTCTFTIKDSLEHFSGLEKFSNHIHKMYRKQFLCDVTLRVQNKDFRAHKSVLKSRSPILAEALSLATKREEDANMKVEDANKKVEDANRKVEVADKKEGETDGIVIILDCDPEAFECYLDFIYSGRFDNTYADTLTIELCKIAHKYYDLQLMEQCLLHLVNDLSVENVIDVTILSQKYRERDREPAYSGESRFTWERRIQDFFNKHWVEVFDTAKWNVLVEQYPALVDALVKNIGRTMKQKSWNRLVEKITDEMKS